MLNSEQITAFCNATALYTNSALSEATATDADYELYRDVEPEDVADVSDTVDSFIKLYGEPDDTEESSFGTLLVWDDLQTSKSKRRGRLLVMDFGDRRAARLTVRYKDGC